MTSIASPSLKASAMSVFIKILICDLSSDLTVGVGGGGIRGAGGVPKNVVLIFPIFKSEVMDLTLNCLKKHLVQNPF